MQTSADALDATRRTLAGSVARVVINDDLAQRLQAYEAANAENISTETSRFLEPSSASASSSVNSLVFGTPVPFNHAQTLVRFTDHEVGSVMSMTLMPMPFRTRTMVFADSAMGPHIDWRL